MDAVSPHDHLSPADGTRPGGVYRVVGRTDGGAVVLRVADTDGRRVHTGEVRRLDADELSGFEPADDPDRNRSLRSRAAASPTTAYWSVRAFLDQLRAHPLASWLALVALVIGSLGSPYLPIGEAGLDALVLLGGLGLAAVGSGRL